MMSAMSELKLDPERDPLLADLTEPQRDAVTHKDGPLLVLAGPGSGKTRVITRRIAYLIQRHDVPPWHVLAITFTNKAAGEMLERVGTLVSARQAKATTVATFHSFCARTLRFYAQRIGLAPTFVIYDTSDQQRVVKRALELLEISQSNFSPAKVLNSISSAKNELLDAQGYKELARDYYSRKVADVYVKYQEMMAQSNALDFDDLLLKTLGLVKKYPDLLEEMRSRYRYVLVDEYQDTNHAQFVLASALAGPGFANLCVTGDPDQSIYGWRGANLGNILEFEQHYPDARIVRLEQNYRSTGHILAAADGLIRNNTRRRHKALWTENESGAAVNVVRCADERTEANWVVSQFQRWHEQHNVPWSGFAVFYRTNSLSRVIEDALRLARIPYQVVRGTAFFERKEVKDTLAYLRVIANPADEVNLSRIINLPARGISNNTVKAMQAHAVTTGQTLDEVIHAPEPVASLTKRAVQSVRQFAQQLDDWRSAAGLHQEGLLPSQDPTLTLRSLLEQVLRESGLEEHYRKDNTDVDGDRLENLGELVSSAQQYEDDALQEIDAQTGEPALLTLGQKLTGYLEQIALISDIDGLEAGDGSVTLMTLHAAKGLEFPVVAILGCEEGLLPHQRALEENGIEEERRLMFVGITRAMRGLTLTHTRRRTHFGTLNASIPSRFLQELPSETIQSEDLDDEPLGTPAGVSALRTGATRAELLQSISQRQRDAAEGLAAEFPPGTMVRHPQFGVGRVVTVTPGHSHTRARVEFNRLGVKNLVLQYTKLERVEN